MIWALLLAPLLIVALGALGQYLAIRDGATMRNTRSRAARAASAEKPHVSTGVSSLNCAGADAPADAPAASWEEWQKWAARAPHGQKRERQRTLIQYTAALLRQEVGQ